MKLPIISAKKLCSFLEKEDFVCLRQKGSHKIYRHADGRMTVVPIHAGKKIKRGLLRGILKEIKVERKAFLRKI